MSFWWKRVWSLNFLCLLCVCGWLVFVCKTIAVTLRSPHLFTSRRLPSGQSLSKHVSFFDPVGNGNVRVCRHNVRCWHSRRTFSLQYQCRELNSMCPENVQVPYKDCNQWKWKLMRVVKRIKFAFLQNLTTAFKKVRQSTFYAFVRTILLLERNTSPLLPSDETNFCRAWYLWIEHQMLDSLVPLRVCETAFGFSGT